MLTSLKRLVVQVAIAGALASGAAIALERPASAQCIGGTFCCGELGCQLLYINQDCDAWYCEWNPWRQCCTAALPDGSSPCNTCELPY